MGKCSKAAKSEVLFVLEDLGLDLGDKQTNLDCLTFRDLIGFLDERKRTLNFKSLKLGFKSECLKSPEEWKRSIASGPDFDLGSHGLLENKCNLGDYLITPFMLLRDAISRFIKRDPEHKRPWILAVRKVSWGRAGWELLKSFGVRVVQTYGTAQTVKARLRRLLHLWVRGGRASDNSGGYLQLEQLDRLNPLALASFASDRVFHGKGPPPSTSSSVVSSSWFSLKNGQGVLDGI